MADHVPRIRPNPSSGLRPYALYAVGNLYTCTQQALARNRANGHIYVNKHSFISTIPALGTADALHFVKTGCAGQQGGNPVEAWLGR